MDLGDALRQSLNDLRQNRMRSALTMFGIAWGIASVVFLIAIVTGFAAGEQRNLETLGHDLMIFWGGRTGRIDPGFLAETAWPPAERPLVYVCGPTGFVEAVADALVTLGHDPSRIRAERFGPT